MAYDLTPTTTGYTDASIQYAARVYNNADLTITNATATTLTFNSEETDTATMHSTASNTDRLTAWVEGVYLVVAHVAYAALNTTGVRQLYLYKNGGAAPIAVASNPGTSATTTPVTLATLVLLAAGDYVTVKGYQDSGASLNILYQGDFTPYFSMARIG